MPWVGKEEWTDQRLDEVTGRKSEKRTHMVIVRILGRGHRDG